MIQKVTTFVTAIYFLVMGFFAHPSQYYFTDWQAVQSLKPTSMASQYIDTLKITDFGKYALAGSDPQIESKAQFNALCQPAATVIELGCYVGGLPDHIYVMQVNDPAVSTVMNVTMAHEFLHAEYNRLTLKKKKEVDALIEKQLAKESSDTNLQKRLAGYAKSEPGQQNNELHSIFGTEYSDLSPELVSYYSQYFKDRKMIVAWSEANTAYINGKQQELQQQKAQIEVDSANLKSLEGRMNTYLAQGNISLYNSLVPSQNAQVRNLNSAIADYNAKVAAYNDLIASISNQTYSSFDAVK